MIIFIEINIKFNDILLIKDYITGVLVSALCKNMKIIKTNKEGSSNKNVYFRNVVAGAKEIF